MVHGSVVHELVRKTGQISVHVISADDGESVPPKSVQTRPKVEPVRIEPYLGSAVAVAVALGIGELLSRFIDVHSISLAFLTAVLASADCLGPIAVAFRQHPERSRLQFFLPGAALHFYGRGSR